MSTTASNFLNPTSFELPVGVNVHWETQRQVVWNRLEHTREEREFVYEISWIEERGLWRTFLCSQRKVES